MYYPLIHAIEGGDVAAVESFLQTPGIDIDFSFVNEIRRYTLLSWAILCKHKTIVEVLLAHGATVNGVLHVEQTPLQVACSFKNANEEVINVLLEHGADIDGMTGFERETPLTCACVSNTNLGIVQLLIDNGADVNGNGSGIAPLHCAAHNGNTEALELLIEAGADVNILSTEENNEELGAGSTPLHFATNKGQSRYLTILLAGGADPNIGDANGQTALHSAAWRSSVDVVNALLNANCDPLHRDNLGCTALQNIFQRRPNRYLSSDNFNSITTLVAAGDRSWESMQIPCPGLEAAMLSVWQAAPDEMPELVKRMKNPPQSLIELFPRMDDAMKKVVQEVLRGLHHHYAHY